MACSKGCRTTGKAAATAASKLLRSKRTSKAVKKVAASDLGQRKRCHK